MAAIATRFAVDSPVIAVRPLGKGLINRTYRVETQDAVYVLQRLNERVFPHPGKLLDNLHRVARHLRGRLDDRLRLPALIPSRDAKLGVRDDSGGCWRMLEHLSDTCTLPRIVNLGQASSVGRILGRFHYLCADLDPVSLAVTLPGFHVTPSYHAQLLAAIGRHPDAIQPPEVRAALRFIATREHLCEVLEAARADGRLPLRVVHGDPKLDNILFDAAGQRAVCLIDLDTVQPGLLLQDLGDCLRSCCNRRGESGGDATFDLSLCRAILTGYAEETTGLLGRNEIALLFDAIRLIPFELSLRFLTDHLEGDRWFRVAAHGDNLIKAQGQIALVADIEAKEPMIRGMIAETLGKVQK